MRLILPRIWSARYFAEDSRPSEITVRRWLTDGKVPGRKIGGTWYVDEHAWQADGDDLVQRVLEAG